MNQTLLLAFVAAVIASSTPAYAQDTSQIKTMQKETMAQRYSDLNQRYEKCMNDLDCPTQDRLSIMMGINDEIQNLTKQIDQTCMDVNYQNCIGHQATSKRQWYKMHNQIGTLMKTIDPDHKESAMRMMDKAGESMSKQEPAAGRTYEEKVQDRESWWRDMWDNKEKPEMKND